MSYVQHVEFTDPESEEKGLSAKFQIVRKFNEETGNEKYYCQIVMKNKSFLFSKNKISEMKKRFADATTLLTKWEKKIMEEKKQ